MHRHRRVRSYRLYAFFPRHKTTTTTTTSNSLSDITFADHCLWVTIIGHHWFIIVRHHCGISSSDITLADHYPRLTIIGHCCGISLSCITFAYHCLWHWTSLWRIIIQHHFRLPLFADYHYWTSLWPIIVRHYFRLPMVCESDARQ